MDGYTGEGTTGSTVGGIPGSTSDGAPSGTADDRRERVASSYHQRIERLREALDGSTRVVFFGGAGVSTESGIPDFRSKDGLYNLRYDYPPETMLSHSFYRAHTAEFYRFYREKVMAPALAAQPNAAHRALAKLEADGHLTAVVTQNIDGLHQAAGSRNVLELHGSIHRNLCERCDALYGAEELLALLAAAGAGGDREDGEDGEDDGIAARTNSPGKPLALPHCTRPNCDGILKPDIVLYEEALDSTTLDAAIEAVTSAEVLIVGGTSLAVNPAAGLVRLFRGTTLVVINRDETWGDVGAALIFRENIARVLGDAVT